MAAVPGAYAVSRLKFFGHRQVSALFLAVYMFPATLLAVPLFVIFAKIGLSSSLAGLAIVYVAQTVPVSIYMLKNYLVTIPASIEEAAALDGCSRLQTVRKVILPLALPSLIGDRPVRLHDRLERVPLRAAVPGRRPGPVDRLPGPAPGSPTASRCPRPSSWPAPWCSRSPWYFVFFAAERLLTEG